MQSVRFLKLTFASVLILCLATFLAQSLHWPLVSDAALIRYATFLLGHGWAPYRQVQDYNLPGAYLVDWLVVRTLGPSDLAWRVFDLTLLASIATAFYTIARPFSRFAALFAFALFALFHARDGIAQTGQRDLTMTALLLAATAILLSAGTRRPYLTLGLFSLLVGSAATIKPIALLLLPIPLLLSNLRGLKARHILPFPAAFGRWGDRRAQGSPEPEDLQDRPPAPVWLISPLPLILATVPIAAALLWITHEHALSAFRFTLFHLIPLHATLGYPGFWFLISRCLTASHLTLFLFAMVLALTNRRADLPYRRARLVLVAGMLFGLVSFVAQGKGFPYQRYPFTAFLFLFAGLEFTFAFAIPIPLYRRTMALAGLLFGVVLAPLYTFHAVKERWPAEPYTSLAADLRRLDAGSHGAQGLSGKIQCLDTISGCLATLNTLHLLPATGLFYDEFLFASTASLNRGQAATVETIRSQFLGELERRPPRVLVMTSFLFPRGPDEFKKLVQWPAFGPFLDRCYTVETERIFPVQTKDPTSGYRLYLRRPACGGSFGT